MKNNDAQPSSDSFSLPLQLSTDGDAIKTDQNLIDDGWVRRHLADPDRAKESTELYTSMGFDVLAKKLKPEDFGSQCQSCAQTICRTYVLIYTRKPDGRKEADNPTTQPDDKKANDHQSMQ